MKDDSGLQYHVKVKPGDVGRYVLLPGDPGRVDQMAEYLDDAQFVSFNREHKVYTGTLLGEKVSIVSTGMGCPSTAIAMEELIAVGADTFIRVGTSGAVQPWLKLGDVAVVTGAIRDEGTTRQYLPIEFPAIADIEVVNALAEASKRVGANYYLGVSQTKDSFYGEVERERMPMAAHLEERWKAWEAGGAICSEMEAAAIFILSSIYRKRAGGVMMVIGSDIETLLKKQHDKEIMIKAAIEAIKILIEQDRAKAA
jgi:uridine phosphorylase